jgi:putative ABC transport system permease protein
MNYTPEGGGINDEIIMQTIDVDYDFPEVYGLKIIKGRYFSKYFSTDTCDSYILNESAVKKLGWTNPIGKRITLGSYDSDTQFRNIIGILPDFNYSSLSEEINPAVFRLKSSGGKFLSLRLSGEKTENLFDFLQQTSSVFSPAYPFDYFFIKERFEKYNSSILKIGKLLAFFSILAVLISCIGVLGLVSFSTEQKSKEIGIRRVHGATVSGIVVLLCREFVKWVFISNIIIWPFAFVAVKEFLNGFAYRTSVGYEVFTGSLVISVIITILTVAFHAIKAATANPVVSLRYE